jgi:hypothetical protein
MKKTPHIKIKNWNEFQHFKDRSPPWIKLYRENLYRRDIMMLSDRNFKILVCLWMLASEDKERNGNLPPIDDIAYKLRLPEKEITKAIQELDGFLIYDDIYLISDRYQHDAPETETETEREGETETKGFLVLKDDFESWWSTYPNKVGKADAKKKFLAALKKTTSETLMAGLKNYIETKPPDRPWCNPATWLHQERWDDAPANITKGTTNGKSIDQIINDVAAEYYEPEDRPDQNAGLPELQHLQPLREG